MTLLQLQVVIDDMLPVDAYSNILGSYSNSRDEFWVSLLEKAYMKVRERERERELNSLLTLALYSLFAGHGWI